MIGSLLIKLRSLTPFKVGSKGEEEEETRPRVWEKPEEKKNKGWIEAYFMRKTIKGS